MGTNVLKHTGDTSNLTSGSNQADWSNRSAKCTGSEGWTGPWGVILRMHSSKRYLWLYHATWSNHGSCMFARSADCLLRCHVQSGIPTECDQWFRICQYPPTARLTNSLEFRRNTKRLVCDYVIMSFCCPISCQGGSNCVDYQIT